MARGSKAWRFAAWRCIGGAAGGLTLLSACGGQAFVLSEGAGDGSTGPQPDAGVADGSSVPSSDASSVLACNPNDLPCMVGSACCTGPGQVGSCTMGMGTCGCQQTSLRCTSDVNCQAPGMPHCCVGQTTSATCSGSEFFASTCKFSCVNGDARLCNPASPSCALGTTCSTNNGDLQKWGLPQGGEYGVCL